MFNKIKIKILTPINFVPLICVGNFVSIKFSSSSGHLVLCTVEYKFSNNDK